MSVISADICVSDTAGIFLMIYPAMNAIVTDNTEYRADLIIQPPVSIFIWNRWFICIYWIRHTMILDARSPYR